MNKNNLFIKEVEDQLSPIGKHYYNSVIDRIDMWVVFFDIDVDDVPTYEDDKIKELSILCCVYNWLSWEKKEFEKLSQIYGEIYYKLHDYIIFNTSPKDCLNYGRWSN